jgi:hypothetical protein
MRQKGETWSASLTGIRLIGSPDVAPEAAARPAGILAAFKPYDPYEM